MATQAEIDTLREEAREAATGLLILGNQSGHAVKEFRGMKHWQLARDLPYYLREDGEIIGIVVHGAYDTAYEPVDFTNQTSSMIMRYRSLIRAL